MGLLIVLGEGLFHLATILLVLIGPWRVSALDVVVVVIIASMLLLQRMLLPVPHSIQFRLLALAWSCFDKSLNLHCC